MAFGKAYHTENEEQCPICRRMFSDGRTIIHKEYMVDGKAICSDCFIRSYKNDASGYDIGKTDDTKNLLWRFMPAPISERNILFERNTISDRHEYVMPYMPLYRLVFGPLMWLFICLTADIMRSIFFDSSSSRIMLIGTVIMNGIIFIVSILWTLARLGCLIKGVLEGMGSVRRIVILLSISELWMLAFMHFPYQISDLIGLIKR